MPHARSPTRRRSPAYGPNAPPPRGDLRRGRPSHRRDGWVPAGIVPPTVPAVPTALEAHERVGGHAAPRQSVLVRAVIASFTRPTQIEIPIPIPIPECTAAGDVVPCSGRDGQRQRARTGCVAYARRRRLRAGEAAFGWCRERETGLEPATSSLEVSNVSFVRDNARFAERFLPRERRRIKPAGDRSRPSRRRPSVDLAASPRTKRCPPSGSVGRFGSLSPPTE